MKNCEKKLKRSVIAAQKFLVLVLYFMTIKLDLKPCLRKLRAASRLPIEVKGVVCLPVVIGPKSYEHDFCVLHKSEGDCLLGLDLLETNKCDLLVSCMKL